MAKCCIYLDHNATTPMHPQVIQAMLACFETCCGNPSSIHSYGVKARYDIEAAREKTALALGIGLSAESVVFTGGGTEANNLAVMGAFWGARRQPGHIVCSLIEHSSVRNTVQALKDRHGASVTWVGPERNGQVSPQAIEDALTPDTVLVCLMAANNETGIVQPVAEVAEICARHRVVLHSDCVQLFGKAPLPAALSAPHVTLAVSAHKFYGPQGVGALVVPPTLPLPPVIFGGGQERGLRSGTENVAGIVGLATAAGLQSDAGHADSLRQLRQQMWQVIEQGIPGVVQNGDPALCLPGTLSLSIPHVKGPDVVRRLDKRGVCLSAGSACSSGRRELSPVIRALGLDESIPWGAIRLSLGHKNTREEALFAAHAVVEAVQELKAGAA